MTTYPGGKNGSGVYQAIINQMPPHQVYVEGFLGSGAVLRHKLPAPVANIGIDVDAEAINNFDQDGIPLLQIIHADVIGWITMQIDWEWKNQHIKEYIFRKDALLYLDPPYLMSTRRQQRQIYRCELSDDDHVRLLDIITSLPCMVMISGYYSEMYANALAGWRTVQFQTTTRGGGVADEWLWMNYPEPFELHDYRYLGSGYRERERIKRKKARWVAKLQRMSSLERYAVLEAVQEARDR